MCSACNDNLNPNQEAQTLLPVRGSAPYCEQECSWSYSCLDQIMGLGILHGLELTNLTSNWRPVLLTAYQPGDCTAWDSCSMSLTAAAIQA